MSMISFKEGVHKETACHYLFGKEAEAIFPSFQGKGAVVNKGLELLMRVNIHFLMHRDGYIFDVMSMNTQCHLFSTRIAQIKHSYKGKDIAKKDEQLSARNQENRFLHLGMFLNFAFLSSTRLFEKAVQKAMNEIKPYAGNPKTFKKTKLEGVTHRQLRTFLLDDKGHRQCAARIALVNVFKNHLQESLKAAEDTPISKELYQLSLLEEDLLKMPTTLDPKLTKRSLDQRVYTYPNFAGMVCVTDFIAKEKISVVVKAKVLSKEGACGIVSAQKGEIADDSGVLIYEGIFTDGRHAISKYRELAKPCPTYYFRNIKKIHKKEVSCDYCKQNPNNVDLAPYQKRLEGMMQNLTVMLLANGVACTYGSRQKDYLKFFTKNESFPSLSALFAKVVPFVEQMGISDSDFSICHGRYDTAASAKSKEFVMDQNPEQFLQARELIL